MRPPDRKRKPSAVVREDAEPEVKRSKRQAAKLRPPVDDGDEIARDIRPVEPASPVERAGAAAAAAADEEEQHQDLPATRARAGHARHSPGAGTPAAWAPGVLCGPALTELMQQVRDARCSCFPPGTPIWVKLRGYCHWPALTWKLDWCTRTEQPDIIHSFSVKPVKPGAMLVRFYGECSSTWVDAAAMSPLEQEQEARMAAMPVWGKKSHKWTRIVAATLQLLQERVPDVEQEVARMQKLSRDAGPPGAEALAASSGALLISSRRSSCWGRAGPARFSCRQGDTCCGCGELGPTLICSHCERQVHTLCAQPPALELQYMPVGYTWACPGCGASNEVLKQATAAVRELDAEEGDDPEDKDHRMGLTPDWIIDLTAFHVFQLKRPTPLRPYIEGLLDPCTNSKASPNIPAEVMYDKEDNGLKLSNSWAGYYILLNPDFKQQVQWRFVNRAIDEVENNNVPAMVLLCRNSTDTAYYQRLRPYPRILMRRSATQFKDYTKSPIGFGVVVFLVTKQPNQDLFVRFYEAFASRGEANIPIDKELLQLPAFYDLLARLRADMTQHQRDHWVQCSACNKWRIIPWARAAELGGDDWTCDLLNPPHSSCSTPPTKAEMAGAGYGADGPEVLTHAAPAHQMHLAAGGSLVPLLEQQAPAPPEETTPAGGGSSQPPEGPATPFQPLPRAAGVTGGSAGGGSGSTSDAAASAAGGGTDSSGGGVRMEEDARAPAAADTGGGTQPVQQAAAVLDPAEGVEAADVAGGSTPGDLQDLHRQKLSLGQRQEQGNAEEALRQQQQEVEEDEECEPAHRGAAQERAEQQVAREDGVQQGTGRATDTAAGRSVAAAAELQGNPTAEAMGLLEATTAAAAGLQVIPPAAAAAAAAVVVVAEDASLKHPPATMGPGGTAGANTGVRPAQEGQSAPSSAQCTGWGHPDAACELRLVPQGSNGAAATASPQEGGAGRAGPVEKSHPAAATGASEAGAQRRSSRVAAAAAQRQVDALPPRSGRQRGVQPKGSMCTPGTAGDRGMRRVPAATPAACVSSPGGSSQMGTAGGGGAPNLQAPSLAAGGVGPSAGVVHDAACGDRSKNLAGGSNGPAIGPDTVPGAPEQQHQEQQEHCDVAYTVSDEQRQDAGAATPAAAAVAAGGGQVEMPAGSGVRQQLSSLLQRWFRPGGTPPAAPLPLAKGGCLEAASGGGTAAAGGGADGGTFQLGGTAGATMATLSAGAAAAAAARSQQQGLTRAAASAPTSGGTDSSGAAGAQASAANRVQELLWQLCFKCFQAALARQLVMLSAAHLVAASQGTLSTSAAEALLRGSASQGSGGLKGTGTPSTAAGGAPEDSKSGANTRRSSHAQQQLQQADQVRAAIQEWMTQLIKLQLQQALAGLGPQELAVVEGYLGTAGEAAGDITNQQQDAGQGHCLNQLCILGTVLDPVLQQVLLEGGTGDATPHLRDLQGLLQQCGSWATLRVSRAQEQDDHSKQQQLLPQRTAAGSEPSAQPTSTWLLKQQLLAAVEQHQQQHLLQKEIADR